MIFDRKKAATVILSKMGKDGRSTETEMKPESAEHDEYSAFAEDIIGAVKDGSVQRLAAALKAFHGMVQEEDAEQDAEE